MSRRVVVVRPEPGNARTIAAARARGLAAAALPFFAVRPLAWEAPDPAGFDALVLTSANAVRHGGAALAGLAALPVLAVGEATAAAARAAGLRVALVGEGGGERLAALAAEAGHRRLLHLAGREHVALAGAATIPVYASEALPLPRDLAERLADGIVLLHSARAARRLAAAIGDRAGLAVAAISAPVLAAAGPGWRSGVTAAQPTDAALLAAAALAD